MPVATAAIGRLLQSDVHITGVVLNKMCEERDGHELNYEYYGYEDDSSQVHNPLNSGDMFSSRECVFVYHQRATYEAHYYRERFIKVNQERFC